MDSICYLKNKSPLHNNYQQSYSLSESFPAQKNINYQIQKFKNQKINKYDYTRQNKILNKKLLKNNLRPKSSINSLKQKDINIKSNLSKKEQNLIFNALYFDIFYRKEKLRKLSQEKEERFNSLYTFSPKTNLINNKYRNKISKSCGKLELEKNKISNNFINRLSNYERKKKENLNKIKNEIYENSPHPKKRKLSERSFKLPYNSQKFLSAKNEKSKKLREELLNEQGVTFKPKLNDNINLIIIKSFQQRNLDYQKAKEIKLNNAKEDIECTFSPKINNEQIYNYSNNINNKSSYNISTNLNTKSIINNFNVGDRLYNYQYQYKKKLEEIKNKNEKYYSFKPKISKNTNLILQRKQRIKDLMREKQLFEEYYKTINNTEKNKENKEKEKEKEEEEKEEEENKTKNKLNKNKRKKNEKKIINNYSSHEDNEFKKYFIINSKLLNLNKRPIGVNIYNNNNFKLFCAKNKTGRNFINSNQGSFKQFSNEEKERPTTNCSTTNSKSKSIVNLNYYDNLI